MSKATFPAPQAAGRGLIIAAPSSGCGKTVITLGLLRALSRRGRRVAAAKAGPDYIDAGFLAAACGRPVVNLDPWAMRGSTLATLCHDLAAAADLVLVEGTMGLFDGAVDGSGSAADLAALTGWPVLLVIDAKGQGASAAALLRGFAQHRRDVQIAGVVFNRVGSPRHRQILNRALAALHEANATSPPIPPIPVLGHVPRDDGLQLPDRHLGLIQACEQDNLPAFLDHAATLVEAHLDLDRLHHLAAPATLLPGDSDAPQATPPLPPPGQRIALASDDAFSFTYAHMLDGWRAQGAEIIPFSPLADAPPDDAADAVWLPGGYPELHAGRLAANRGFLAGLRAAAARGAFIYGECGGYMVLGRGITDREGAAHAMAGLLPLTTAMDAPRPSLGYRRALCHGMESPLFAAGGRFRGHEFHYARICAAGPAPPLFDLADAAGASQPHGGLVAGKVAGSFLHIVDRAPATEAAP